MLCSCSVCITQLSFLFVSSRVLNIRLTQPEVVFLRTGKTTEATGHSEDGIRQCPHRGIHGEEEASCLARLCETIVSAIDWLACGVVCDMADKVVGCMTMADDR
jgi:hypothetical protein